MHYVLNKDVIIPIKCHDIVVAGKVVDHRIIAIEDLVAQAFNTTVHELDVFYKDTPAKLMCCFLVHHLLNYSVGSIANKYKVYPLFLRNKIIEHYSKCLQDNEFMQMVTQLKEAYLQAQQSPPSIQNSHSNLLVS